MNVFSRALMCLVHALVAFQIPGDEEYRNKDDE